MAIAVSGGEKGGTGKTMWATSLAVCAAECGVDVLLVDADGQGSATRWAIGRAEQRDTAVKLGATNPPVRIPHVVLRGNTLHALRDLEKRYQLVVVDAGGADSEEFATSVTTADAVYSPVIPSDCDLGTVATIDRVVSKIRSIGRDDLIAKVVLNLCSNHTAARDVEEAAKYLGDFPNLSLARAVIHHRDAFKDAYKARITVVEAVTRLTPRERTKAAKAAEEIWALYREVAGDLGLAVPAVPVVHAVPEVQ